MALKTKTDLKDVFNGLSSVMFQEDAIDLSEGTIAIAPDYDLPVTVDTLTISQDEPTINHYKVIGLDADWTSSSTAGEMNISFTVPTKQTDLLKLVYGTSSVTAKTGVTFDSGTYSGNVVTQSSLKITGSIVLVDAEKKNLFVISNVALWASPVMDNASTEPLAFRFTGTVESAGSSKPDFAFLTKVVNG